MDPASKLELRPLVARTRLSFSFHAPTLERATALAADLRRVDGHVPRILLVNRLPSSRRERVVTVTTPEIPLNVTVLRRREAELVAIEERWPGCRFLGWRMLDREPDVRMIGVGHLTGAA